MCESKIRDKSNGYPHINGILIIKIVGKYRKMRIVKFYIINFLV